MNLIQQTDFQILDYIQHIKNPAADIFFRYITTFGNAGFLWILTAVLLLTTKQYRKDGIAVSAAVIISFIICFLIKNTVCRPRPFNIDTSVHLLIQPPKGYSFPSGHSCVSFAAATVLIKTAVKRIGIPALTAAVLISFSRLYLYVHFPSDVIIGSLIGAACGILAVKITNI